MRKEREPDVVIIRVVEMIRINDFDYVIEDTGN